MHDRLGSVRQVFDPVDLSVKNNYVYDAWGLIIEGETTEDIPNPYRFASYVWDSEISQYHCYRRQYDPVLARFTSRDPIRGDLEQPMTLHVYLYCLNDPVNRIDPEGRFALDLSAVNSILTGAALYAHAIDLATYAASSGNLKFFELTGVTVEFMLMGMSVAWITPIRDLRYLVAGYGGSFALEAAFQKTGMSYAEGFAMDPAAFFLYAGVMATAEEFLDVSGADMEDFAEWHGSWPWE
jgi:RHS repeat-associated protein